jgi:hypothetical protein
MAVLQGAVDLGRSWQVPNVQQQPGLLRLDFLPASVPHNWKDGVVAAVTGKDKVACRIHIDQELQNRTSLPTQAVSLASVAPQFTLGLPSVDGSPDVNFDCRYVPSDGLDAVSQSTFSPAAMNTIPFLWQSLTC